MGKFIVVFFVFFEIQIVTVAEFYGIIHVKEETQKIWLTNACLEYDSVFVYVAFTARTKFCRCFVIDGILKITHIFREENACADKLINLWFIHKESFH